MVPGEPVHRSGTQLSPSQPSLVALRSESRERRLERRDGLVEPELAAQQPSVCPLRDRTRCYRRCTDAMRLGLCCVEGSVCLRGSAAQPECDRLLPHELRPPRTGGEERHGSGEQARGGGGVVHAPDAHARFAEPFSGCCRELVGVLAELAPQECGLLEVVAGDDVVAGAVAVDPGGAALVEVGAVGLGQAARRRRRGGGRGGSCSRRRRGRRRRRGGRARGG